MSVARLNIAKENCSFSLFSVVTLCILSFFCWQWKKESQRKLSRSKRITTDTSARSKAAIKVRLLCVVKRGPQMMTLKKPAKPLVKKPVAKKPIVTMTTKIDQIITRRRKQNQQFKKSHLMKLTLSNQKHLSRGGGAYSPPLSTGDQRKQQIYFGYAWVLCLLVMTLWTNANFPIARKYTGKTALCRDVNRHFLLFSWSLWCVSLSLLKMLWLRVECCAF